MQLARVLSLLLILGSLGCRTTVRRSPFSPDAPPTFSLPKRAWEMVEAGRVVGIVVEFEDRHQVGRRFFSVRNADHHELGLVDSVGRAWRYEPHQAEALWLGSGPVIEGAARILGLAGESELYEVELEALAAEARARSGK